MEYTPRQLEAISLIQSWFEDWQESGIKQVFFLTGQAGTGKTSIARAAAEGCVANPEQIAYIAPTGKAASRLRQKGCENAKTMHQFTYRLVGEDENGDPRFSAKTSLNETPRLVVLDEGSMVSEWAMRDLLAHNLPILVLGDLNQLPPVKAPAFLTEGNEDFELTDIMRQGAESNIIRAATFVRQGKILPLREYDDVKIREGFPTLETLLAHSGDDAQVLCARNDTRNRTNDQIRNALGFTADLPTEGAKIVCLMNQHQRGGMMNGEQCILIAYEDMPEYDKAVNDSESMCYAKVRSLDDGSIKRVKFNPDAFSTDPEIKAKAQKTIGAFDWGWVLTVHKAQGSEFPRVAFIEQMLRGGDATKLRYTAYTRAEKFLEVYR